MADERVSRGRGPDVEWCAQDDFPPGWHLPAHAHAGLGELIVVLAGRLTTRVGREVRTAAPGTVVVHWPGVAHEEWVEGRARLRTLYVSWHAAPMPEPCGPRWIFDDLGGRIESAARWIHELRLTGGPEDLATANDLLRAALREPARPDPTPDDLRMRMIRRHIEANLSFPLTLEGLAAVGEISPSQCVRIFRRSTGTSPMTYVRRQRVAAARHLIAATTLTLDAIALRVGLNDRFHLSRVYRRELGTAPRAHRRLAEG